MIISKTPLRVSLLGGGTDYPEFVNRYGGSVLGGTIDKYIYLTANKLSSVSRENLRLCYRSVESVEKVDDITHPIFREYLKNVAFQGRYAFYTVSDIPGNSGLGSSSSFTIGLIKLIDEINGSHRSRKNLAKTAIHLEREILCEQVGYQDQYHAAFGGFTRYNFSKSDVELQECNWTVDDYKLLNSQVCLISTGIFRDAKAVLKQQKIDNSDLSKDDYLQNMLKFVDEGYALIKDGLTETKIRDLGALVKESWEHKKKLSKSISNNKIDELIEIGLGEGAKGAKLLGAGAGGFILFIGDISFQRKIRALVQPKYILDLNFQPQGSTIYNMGLSNE